MASLFASMLGWFGLGSPAMAERSGQQFALPSVPLVPDVASIGADAAMQIATVWACVERRANTVASLPCFAYDSVDGQKTLARDSRLFKLLHDTPNSRMTPMDFWRAMVMNHDLRGTAYARIERDPRSGEAVSLWPMPTDQVQPFVLDDGTMAYQYRIDGDVMILAQESVLPIRGLGNGTVGLSRLEFMRATTDEMAKAQASASRVFGTGGKPTGILMIDHVLKQDQRDSILERFRGMASGNDARLYLLEASMKYQQLSMTPEDQQLLSTRHYGVEEICRWFDVPPVLVHHSNVTTWGTGVEQIVDGFYKLTVRPMLVNIEQAIRKHVLTPRQRVTMSVEFNLDALLRGSAKDRAELYAKNVQNGIMTRNEARQLENLPPDASRGANTLTAQSNLTPLDMLGQQPTTQGAARAAQENPVAQ